MKLQTFLQTSLVIGCAFALNGCGHKDDSAGTVEGAGDADATVQSTDQPANAATSEGLAAARAALQSGQFDDAAARLTQLQAAGASFNTQQAKDYRTVLSEAYDRAIEGAQRGDPKAQAALQLLRAAAPR